MVFQVMLEDSQSAIALRKSFARYTRKKSPLSRPPELDGVEVFNSVTLATRVRISILRVSFILLVLNLFMFTGTPCFCLSAFLFFL